MSKDLILDLPRYVIDQLGDMDKSMSIIQSYGVSTEDALYVLSVLHAIGKERIDWWRCAQEAISLGDECMDDYLRSIITNHQVYYSTKGIAVPIVVQQVVDKLVAMRDARTLAIATVKVKPCEVVPNFMGSSFNKSEMESMMANLLVMACKMDEHNWVPFTWADYCSHMTHPVGDTERKVIDALVNGGNMWAGRCGVYKVPAGYLSYDKSTGQYSFTTKCIDWYAQYKEDKI